MLLDLYKTTQRIDFETPAILKPLVIANRYLGELKGACTGIPNQAILISTLGMQESQDSSAIENIVTTQDALYKFQLQPTINDPVAKEVHNYTKALSQGFYIVRQQKTISLSTIQSIQQIVLENKKGFRHMSGEGKVVIMNTQTREIIYTPPKPQELNLLLNDLEKFINDRQSCTLDPLIKMALIHHQFESIHPFYDGNGRVGRILNILYLILNQFLDTPILYLSRYINHNKEDYYRLLQDVRDKDKWEEWVIYMLEGVSLTAQNTLSLIEEIKALLQKQKHKIRNDLPKIYSQDLLNNLFTHPYTKIQFLVDDLNISRATATRYLEALTEKNILEKRRLGRESYYLNEELINLLFNIPQINKAENNLESSIRIPVQSV